MTKKVKYDDKWKAKGYTNIKNPVLFDEYLSTRAKIIYFQLLARDFNGDKISYPNQNTIAKENGVTPKTVQRTMKELEEAGLIEIKHRYNSSNLYILKEITNRYPQFKEKKEVLSDVDYYADLK